MRPLKLAYRSGVVRRAWYASRLMATFARAAKEPPEAIRSIVLSRGSDSTNAPLPNIVWTFWSGERSAIVQACNRSVARHGHDFEVITVSPDNLREFLPDFPEIPPHIPVQKVSNLARLMLLERYGGIWLDASILVTKDLTWIRDAFSASPVGMMGIYNEFPDEYVSNHDRPIIENGFLAAVAGDPFVRGWLSTYRNCILSEDYGRYFQSTHDDFDQLTSGFLRRDQSSLAYFVCYIAAQKAMLSASAYNLRLLNAEDDYYFYYYTTPHPRSRRQFADEVLLKRCPKRVPLLIKITGGHRSVLEDYVRHGCYRATSILGQHL